MDLVATVIAGFGIKLSPALLQDLSRGQRSEWLAPNEAADIHTTGINAEDLRGHLLTCIGDDPFDVILQPLANRRKKFLAADMESTIIEQELLDELAEEIGQRARVVRITQQAMNGELDFAAALRERVGLLRGQPLSLLEKVSKNITLMPGALELIATVRAHGIVTWLITGGFSYFAQGVAAELGFDKCYANALTVDNGLLSGEIGEPLLDRTRKKVLLEQACAELKIDLQDTMCVGDGANDVPMLNASNAGGGLGIAYQAKPAVRAAVPNQINYADLSSLLYVLGLKKSDWCSV